MPGVAALVRSRRCVAWLVQGRHGAQQQSPGGRDTPGFELPAPTQGFAARGRARHGTPEAGNARLAASWVRGPGANARRVEGLAGRGAVRLGMSRRGVAPLGKAWDTTRYRTSGTLQGSSPWRPREARRCAATL